MITICTLQGGDQWRTATLSDAICDRPNFFLINILIQHALQDLENNTQIVTSMMSNRIAVLNFLDPFVGCYSIAANQLLIPGNPSIPYPPNKMCFPDLAKNGDPCCSVEGAWDRCCAPRPTNLPVQIFHGVSPDGVS